jgi:hypothetical protein
MLVGSDWMLTVGARETVESIVRKLPCRNQIEYPARSWVDPVSNLGRGEKQERRGFPVTSGADGQRRN